MSRLNYLKIFGLCIIAAVCNAVLSFTLNGLLGIPLYLDTVFTAAICFSFGLFPSLFTALATAAFFSFIYINLRGFPVETVWTVFAFSICVVLEVLLISFFKPKIEPRKDIFLKKPLFQNFIGLCAPLLVLTALACITVSIAGGLINFIITQFEVHSPSHPEDFFKLGLLRNNVPLLATNILSRIPINIVDRFIVIFGGFGVSLVLKPCK